MRNQFPHSGAAIALLNDVHGHKTAATGRKPTVCFWSRHMGNVGGALIPGAMSIYLLVKHPFGFVALSRSPALPPCCHLLARPIPGLGIALPVFVPAITTAVVALLLDGMLLPSPISAIRLARSSVPILLNLGSIRGLGAPVASIGGAGTFDGVVLAGIVAVLFASLTTHPDRRNRAAASPPR